MLCAVAAWTPIHISNGKQWLISLRPRPWWHTHGTWWLWGGNSSRKPRNFRRRSLRTRPAHGRSGSL